MSRDDALQRFRQMSALRNKHAGRTYKIPPTPEPDDRPRRLIIDLTYINKRDAMNILANLRNRIEYDDLQPGSLADDHNTAAMHGVLAIFDHDDDGSSATTPQA